LALVFYYLTSLVGFWLVATFALVLFFVLIAVAGSHRRFSNLFPTSLFVELNRRGAW
jgi:hypothetical protein